MKLGGQKYVHLDKSWLSIVDLIKISEEKGSSIKNHSSFSVHINCVVAIGPKKKHGAVCYMIKLNTGKLHLTILMFFDRNK